MAKKGTLSRRSFLTTVAGTAALAGATSVVTGSAQAQNYTGNTDSDTGSYADRAGYGRTGYTDSDGGSNADRAGYGRGGGRTGITDSDSGSYADAAGNGRGSSGVTDSDPNDPVGNGRGGRRSGQTDSDTGSYADAPSVCPPTATPAPSRVSRIAGAAYCEPLATALYASSFLARSPSSALDCSSVWW